MNRTRFTSFLATVCAVTLAVFGAASGLLFVAQLAAPFVPAAASIVAVVSHPALVNGVPVTMAMIITTDSIRGLTTAFKTIFNNAFSTAETAWEKVAMKVPSGTAENAYKWLGMSTRFREWLGDRVIQNLKDHGFTIVNKRYENTVGVPKDVILDDQYGVYNPMMAQLGYDAKCHPDELLFDLINRADAVRCYDGQNFLDTDHPVVQADGSIASVANFQPGAQPLWLLIDNTKPIKPFIVQEREKYSFTALDKDTDENVFKRNEYLYGATGRINVGLGLWQLCFGSRDVLSAANYEEARVALRSMEGDGGKKLAITPKLLVVGPTNEGAAIALVKAQKDAAGADNIWFGTADVLVVPWLE